MTTADTAADDHAPTPRRRPTPARDGARGHGRAASDTAAPTTEAGPTPTAGGELIVGTIFDAFGLEPTTFVGGVTDGPHRLRRCTTR